MTREEGEALVREKMGAEAADVLVPLFAKAYPERNPVDLLTLDFIFRLPEMDYIAKRSALNDCTYAYLFNQDLPVDGGRTPWHCADIPYVFHNTSLVPVTQEAGVTEKLERQIFESVIAFAHTGNPDNAYIPHWPVSRPGRKTRWYLTRIPGCAPIMTQSFFRCLRSIWDRFFKNRWKRRWERYSIRDYVKGYPFRADGRAIAGMVFVKCTKASVEG